MTDHSNPITDILTTVRKFEVTEAQALQALYEAVKKCVPGPAKPKTDYDKGWNDSGEAFLTNLSLLFGVADVGASEKPKSGNKPSGKQVDTRSETALNPVGHGGFCPKHGGWSSQVPMMCPGCQEQGNDLQPSDPEADWKVNSEAYNRAGISKEGVDHVRNTK